ncbi:hypothetical protein THASP1DRAFT_17212 [Thamnocephalis sphaerospora]|uniref:Ubiquitin-like modifier-activating enzyme ATG7 n=1 Tax=Thamnocephalis sphaerospora TaxID=78915 RepID=A0A4P9XN42_9FUNG|nr:hypothetical protein THASP1DRAFT_17212 [Thamnocephalis sphaerospora]|eukprot:RKP07336.1 hypothetical protein THASP1DRAFT_17212 [Thamnocephalis sphaerospora]
MDQAHLLQFEPFGSVVDPGFWHQLGLRKLDIYRLDQSEQPLVGWYSVATRVVNGERERTAPAQFSVDGSSFDAAAAAKTRTLPTGVRAHGILINTNTFDEFKVIDKQAWLRKVGEQIADAIATGDAWHHPDVLCRFVLLTFADLKCHRYSYWFGFPALVAQPAIVSRSWTRVSTIWSEDKAGSSRVEQHGSISPFFGVVISKDNHATVVDLADVRTRREQTEDEVRVLLGFVDPSGLTDHPGWPLRNFAMLLARAGWGASASVLCYRDAPGAIGTTSNAIIELELPVVDLTWPPKVVGWEKNPQGRTASRMADLGSLLDPIRLADTAVDLNLKLMRWRLAPKLQLEKVATTKCLLLGAGTLGCYVARALLGWGVRHITFADSGAVSFSNPVRQPLFTYEDCLNGGKPKAVCAAESLSKIFPGVNAAGHLLRIPMPGHPVTNDKQTQEAVESLSNLIDQHDAVFLLMDSRESRWLPTLLGAAKQKIVINAALGFDSFLVMRHGVCTPESNAKLGCYYCNDVVAPADSLKDRSLDQQCTVTRPSLAPIASGMAVELLVSILQHPLGALAPADTSNAPDAHDDERPLGVLPHQIRGQLATFSTTLLQGPAYDRCIACSTKIRQAYQERGYAFLKEAFDDPAVLERLTGLDQLLNEDAIGDWDVADDMGSDDEASLF